MNDKSTISCDYKGGIKNFDLKKHDEKYENALLPYSEDLTETDLDTSIEETVDTINDIINASLADFDEDGKEAKKEFDVIGSMLVEFNVIGSMIVLTEEHDINTFENLIENKEEGISSNDFKSKSQQLLSVKNGPTILSTIKKFSAELDLILFHPTRVIVGIAESDYDFLPLHIMRYKLPLAVSRATPAFGDCWWEAVMDQLRLNNIQRPGNALNLRRMVVKNLSGNACFPTWLELSFGNDISRFNEFVREQSSSGTLTDEDGIIVVATAMFLGVRINIIAPDNNEFHPFTTYQGSHTQEDSVTFWIGHYPHNPDKNKVGHFQSLKYLKRGQGIKTPSWCVFHRS